MAPSLASTQDIVSSVLRGDDEAFARLVDRCAVRLALYVRRNAGRARGPDFDEEDILQSTIGEARRSLESFAPAGPGSFYRWMTGIAVHVIGNRLRYLEAKDRERGRRRAEPGFAEGGTERVPASGRSPSSITGHRERIESLHRSLSELPVELREVVELHFLEELSLSEIGERVGIVKTAVWKRLRLGIARLKRTLASEQDFSGSPA